MGILTALRLKRSQSRPPAGVTGPLTPYATEGRLSKIAYADWLGGTIDGAVTRGDAMKVPAISKARGLIAGTISRLPLKLTDPGGVDQPIPSWLTTPVAGESPLMRMLWTIDDLIFEGSSLWAVERGPAGQITEALRVQADEWELTPDLVILVNGVQVPADQVIFIPGPQDALLTAAAEDIRAALATTRAWAKRVKSPVPLLELHFTDENASLDDEEITELVESWEKARELGGTAYTPATIETKVHASKITDLFIEGRNATRLDLANHMMIPASMIDGSTATASLTYSTATGNLSEFINVTLRYWASAVEARLSMPDVIAPGWTFRLDTTPLEPLATPVQSGRAPAPSTEETP